MLTSTDTKELTLAALKVERLISKGFHVEHHTKILNEILARIDELKAGKDEVIVIDTSETSIEITDEESIDRVVEATKGTWVKRRNLRKRLVNEHNDRIKKEISIIKEAIRSMISSREIDKREYYAEVTRLELKLI